MPRPSPSDHAFPAPAQLDELLRELARFSGAIRERGLAYLEQGRVSALTIEGRVVRAHVRGTQRYETLWRWSDAEGWTHHCSCPMAGTCKHGYALGLAITETVRGATQARGPGPPRRATSSPARARESSARRVRALATLRGSARSWEREEALFLLLGPSIGDPSLSASHGRLLSILAEADPDLRCFRLAREISVRSPESVPAELRPYLARADVLERWAARERAALVDALRTWTLEQRAAPTKRLRVALRLADGALGARVIAEARVSSARLRDEPRTLQQLDLLLGEASRTPGLLADDEFLLLEWLTSHRLGGADRAGAGYAPAHALRQLVTRVAGTALASWSDDLPSELATRAGVTAGGPVVLDETPVRLTPGLTPGDDGPVIALRFVWPDGRSRALHDAIYVSTPRTGPGRAATSLVLAEGTFFPVVAEPPYDVLSWFARVGPLALRAAEDAPLLRQLARRFPEIRAACSFLVRHHHVTPAALVDLDQERWLTLRLVAHTGPPAWTPPDPLPPDARLFEYDVETGWQARSTGVASASSSEPLQLDEPEPADVDPALAWVRDTLARAAAAREVPTPRVAGREARGPWTLAATAESLEVFAHALDQRPHPLPVLATARVRRLLDPGGAPRAKVSVRASGIDFFEISAEWEAEGASLSDEDLAALRAASTRFVRLRSGWVRRSIGAEQEELIAALADLGVEPDGRPARVGLAQLAGAKPESVSTLERIAGDPAAARAARQLRERIERFTGVPPVDLPAGLRAELRPYQKAGLDALAHTSSLGLGSILADDMGLGKTLQALAWILHLRAHAKSPGASLVVCPTSVIHNWAREAARFAPGLRVLVLERGERRHALRREIGRYDLVVTNYALLRRDAAEWARIELFAAILDEAQNIKNPDAAVTRAAQGLRAQHRLALTGTPLENRALDLWSLVGFVNPGYLGARKAFVGRYDQPDAPPHARRLLAAKLRPILLRRLKREVAPELPDRIEERRDCELTAGQRKLYLAELRRSREIAQAESGDARDEARKRIAVLAALTRLRQICCHPGLAGDAKGQGSGKFEALFELLEPLLAEGHKVLVFSQFVRCLDLLRAELEPRGIPWHLLTGDTTKRESVVAAFQEDARPCVFLISLRAGGTGLNLTAASYVVLLDPWWNPAVEAQAIDRTHRIGQERTVIAYRLVARGTVEEKILALQQRKADLVSDVLGEDGLGRSLTREDLAYLFEDP